MSTVTLPVAPGRHHQVGARATTAFLRHGRHHVDAVGGHVLLTGLLQKKASPFAVASDQAARLFYGAKHPLGQPR